MFVMCLDAGTPWLPAPATRRFAVSVMGAIGCQTGRLWMLRRLHDSTRLPGRRLGHSVAAVGELSMGFGLHQLLGFSSLFVAPPAPNFSSNKLILLATSSACRLAALASAP
jgi:hypothetical protein